MTTDTGLDADLGWALGTVFRTYVKAADAVISDLPGGPRGYQVLAAAVQDLPANQVAIARQLGIDRTVLTYLIDDLVRLGLVERRPDPADRRNRRVVATERGREVWSQVQARLRHVEEHVLAALGDDAPAFREMACRLAGALGRGDDPVAETCEAVEELRLRADPR
ncbi:MarR family winged helix-turn-helix transcriptional regulator [Thermoactinospora rubra]|uniref:MarR family winged helix-turn-helix transcriptional regulator n=1 Tax=Thermoactinospora rubra TaxID=1088767 RepID=UPI000A115605|nr:MarR family transcriptional regulator [Thermoactinospora rubra]